MQSVWFKGHKIFRLSDLQTKNNADGRGDQPVGGEAFHHPLKKYTIFTPFIARMVEW